MPRYLAYSLKVMRNCLFSFLKNTFMSAIQDDAVLCEQSSIAMMSAVRMQILKFPRLIFKTEATWLF